MKTPSRSRAHLEPLHERAHRREPPQAVILAAGLGSRLGPAASGRPKCLAEVGGKPLLLHHLDVLADLGIDEICVIIGHLGEMVRRAAGRRCTFIENRLYAETNSLVSLWMARRWVRGPLMVLNGDVLADRAIYAMVACAKGNALAYDSSSGDEAEHMKVAVRRGHIEAIAKDLEDSRCSGENVGVLKFDARGAASLLGAATTLVSAGGLNLWAPAAINAALGEAPVRALDVAGLPWIEIDYAEDLDRAEEQVLPAIVARAGAARRRTTRRRASPQRRLRPRVALAQEHLGVEPSELPLR